MTGFSIKKQSESNRIVNKNLFFLLGLSFVLFPLLTNAQSPWVTTTWNVATGQVVVKTLWENLKDYKDTLSNYLETTYQMLSWKYTVNVLPLIKSPNYQSLVCLWIINPSTLWSDLLKEKDKIKSDLLWEYVLLSTDILLLEGKLKENLIDTMTYSAEKSRLEIKVTNFNQAWNSLIVSFESTYWTKMNLLSQDINKYISQNTELLKTLNDKVIKIQSAVENFKTLEDSILKLNNKISDWNNIIWSLSDTKGNMEKTLSSKLDEYVTLKTNIYKQLIWLNDILSKQKSMVIRLFSLDLDEKLQGNFSKWYDIKDYEYLKEQVQLLKNSFYVNDNLNCSKILNTTLDLWSYFGTIDTKIQGMITKLNNWLVILNQSWSADSIRSDLVNWFKDFYFKNYDSTFNEFKNFSESQIKILMAKFDSNLNNQSNNNQSNNNQTNNQVENNFDIVKFFTKAYKKNEKHENIKTLQNLLKSLSLYDWAVDWVYGQKVINAVYQFQLNNWLLVWYEKRPNVWGWMGPATMKKLNEALTNIQSTSTTSSLNTETQNTKTWGIATIERSHLLTVLYNLEKKFASKDQYKTMLGKLLDVVNTKIENEVDSMKKNNIQNIKTAIQTYLNENQ